MYNYCTLFNSNYLTRGLAMYESLSKCSDYFHLYVFTFDNRSNKLLKELDNENMTIISLSEFEDEELLKVKDKRSSVEYCWTCTPSVIKYAIEKFNLDCCTYLDADLYFFRDPAILIEEMNDSSVMITEHRYTPQYDISSKSGKYCVQFMTFKNDVNGMKVLNWWRNACIEWCYSVYEDGKLGDQMYLDDWMIRFDGVHEMQNLGGGVAPWNVQQYDLSDELFLLVFYHFHAYKFLENNLVDFGGYSLDNNDIEILYKPYTTHLNNISVALKKIDNQNDYNGVIPSRRFYWRLPLQKIKRKLTGTYNVFSKEKLLEM
jgi:hypothetical protein